MAIREVKVVLEVIENELDGSETIVPNERDFAAGESKISQLKKQLEDATSRKDRNSISLLKRQIAALRSAIDTMKQQRAAVIGKAQKYTYTLVKPTYGRWLEAEGSAKTIQDDGSVVVDQLRIQRELLPECVKGMSPEQVAELSPNIAVYLWGVLQNAIWPDPARLPFSLPSSQTSTMED
jgi:hypothetical protein